MGKFSTALKLGYGLTYDIIYFQYVVITYNNMCIPVLFFLEKPKNSTKRVL